MNEIILPNYEMFCSYLSKQFGIILPERLDKFSWREMNLALQTRNAFAMRSENLFHILTEVRPQLRICL